MNSRATYHSGMVRIRLFAALREAAGVPEVEAPAAPLQAILDELGERFGDRFVAVLNSVGLPEEELAMIGRRTAAGLIGLQEHQAVEGG